MNTVNLSATARALVAKSRGILAADESTSTIKKRFDTIKLESTEENRRAYREMLFTAPGAAEYISGVIMYDETLRQKTKDGVPFPAYLAEHGMLPGIKVDMGAKPLAGFPGETITEGLDGLRERLAEYFKLGAKFAKWRAVIDIGSAIPTLYAIDANAEALARYAVLCQEAGIVPIVEPEVLMDGAHTLERCEEVTNLVLDRVFERLFAARVQLEGMVLKPNMVVLRQEELTAGEPRTGRRSHRAHAQAPSTERGARHRVLVGRSKSKGGDAAFELDECGGPVAMGAHVQLWARAAGKCVERVGREICRLLGRPAGIVRTREIERAGRGGGLQRLDGKFRGLTLRTHLRC